MPLVDAKRTRSDAQSIANALAIAWASRFGAQLPGAVAALLLALSDFETATWQSMFNFNPGNMIPSSESQPFFRLRVQNAANEFRAFPDLESGIAEYVAQLTRDTRPEWHAGLLSGDPEQFVRSLGGEFGGPRYFEAPLNVYRKGFLSRYERYRALAERTPNPVAQPKKQRSLKQSSQAAGAVAAVAALLGVGAILALRRVLR